MSTAVAALVVVVVVALAAIALAVAVVAIRRRRRRRRLPRRTGGPSVVLVHGLFGFDTFGIPGARVDYFRGIADHLATTAGARVHVVRLPAIAAVPVRARALADGIAALAAPDRVHVIAHSLGGLDARFALARFGLAARVESLVTIGTPHRGTPLAELATRGPLGVARRMLDLLGLPIDALDWLTPDALARFNRDVPDAGDVFYASVVGGMRDPATPVPLALAPLHAYLRRVAGPNDGLVPVSSQAWGAVIADVEADHFAQIGWRATARPVIDARALYADVLACTCDRARRAA
jgi:triacylglycerol lipase